MGYPASSCVQPVETGIKFKKFQKRVDIDRFSVIISVVACECSSSGRAPPCQGGGSEFEPRHSLQRNVTAPNGVVIFLPRNCLLIFPGRSAKEGHPWRCPSFWLGCRQGLFPDFNSLDRAALSGLPGGSLLLGKDLVPGSSHPFLSHEKYIAAHIDAKAAADAVVVDVNGQGEHLLIRN